MANDLRGSVEGWDFNLLVSSFVEQEDTREKIDIKVLNAEIEQIVERAGTS